MWSSRNDRLLEPVDIIGGPEHACPNVSRATIRRVLNELHD